ncbi:MAG: GNAT family N-acetyltransferase [Pseudomonadota bacterium]|nr:GNAT family N-acetyltransferase [Pseudomonadota bacterium]MDP1906044.1 GNAT family N-acetyltransferase [Pseudomonadota bacterium]MDP2352514.1 GNAT family N-acetyltransferase [Pseudomonadota bacterium]
MLELRTLRPEDERGQFRSGNPALDYFFQQFAGQNKFRHHIGTTYVAVEDGLILGYATVSPAHLECAELAESERKRLPNYPLPVLRLARLATHEEAQGKGIGKALLHHVFLLATRMSADFGCVGLLVDAKPEAVGYYATFGFLPLHPVTGESPMQPLPMFLAIQKLTRLLASGQ